VKRRCTVGGSCCHRKRTEGVAGSRRKRVVVLGSTGSIGESTLDVVRALPERLEVVALGAGANWRRLARQVEEFRPAATALADASCRSAFEDQLGDKNGMHLSYGPDGICELAGWPEADVVVSAVTGWAGFPAAVEALKSGHVLGLANKESLVVGGQILLELAGSCGGTILPVDSEHSAIMQAMRCGRREEVTRVIITASGGPFRGVPNDELADVTPEQALRHPTWRMGRKVILDCATLMNKALEIIETRWLFGLEPEKIEVLIHPQSIIHSLVEFVDGAVMAQLGVPDMKLPIQFVLMYPDRVAGPVERLRLGDVGKLELLEPDLEELPALRLGYEVARAGGTSGAVLNAANEFAVESFLRGEIRFTDIVPLVEEVLHRHQVRQDPDVAQIQQADQWAREEARLCSQTL
jgi:1-deoxy-D-xylulose-5-phosphate reductoisomerase